MADGTIGPVVPVQQGISTPQTDPTVIDISESGSAAPATPPAPVGTMAPSGGTDAAKPGAVAGGPPTAPKGNFSSNADLMKSLGVEMTPLQPTGAAATAKGTSSAAGAADNAAFVRQTLGVDMTPLPTTNPGSEATPPGDQGYAANIAAGPNKAIAGALGFPVDAAHWLATHDPIKELAQAFGASPTGPFGYDKAMLAAQQQPWFGGSASIGQAMGLIGRNPYTVRPVTPEEQVMQAAGEGATSMLMPWLGARALAANAPAWSGALIDALGHGSAAAQMASGAAGAMGSMVADQNMPDWVPDWLRPTVSTLTGMFAGAAPMVAEHAIGAAARPVVNLAEKAVTPLGIGQRVTLTNPDTGEAYTSLNGDELSATPAQIRAVGQRMAGTAGMTPAELSAQIGAADTSDHLPGAPLSAGQLTGNLSLLGRERQLRNLDRAPFTAADAAHKLAQARALAGIGGPAATAAAATDLIDTTTARLQADRDAAMAARMSADDALGLAGKRQPIEHGAEMAEHINRRIAPTLAAADAALTKARADLDASMRAMRGVTDPKALSQIGGRIQQALDGLDKAHKDYVSHLYSLVDPDGTLVVPTADLRDSARKIVRGMSPLDARMEKAEAGLFDAAMGLGDGTKFADLKALRSRATTLARELRKGGPNVTNQEQALARVSRLIDAIENDTLNAVADKVKADAEAVAAGTMKPEDSAGARLAPQVEQTAKQRWDALETARAVSKVIAEIDGKPQTFPDAAHLALYEAGRKIAQGGTLSSAERRALWAHFKGFVTGDRQMGETFARPEDVDALAEDYYAGGAATGGGAHTSVVDPEMAADYAARNAAIAARGDKLPFQVPPEPANDHAPAAAAAPAPSPVPERAPPQHPARTVYPPAPFDPTRAFTPAGREVRVHYRVVEAKDLVASHDASGRENPRYPQALQPRGRDRAASQRQMARIANAPNPHLLGYSADTTTGAPIVGPDMVVESGNGRTAGLQAAYARGGEGVKAYREHLEAAYPEAKGMKEPVLVRVRETPVSDADRPALAEEMGRKATLGMSPAEVARVDAAKLTPDLMGQWQGGSVTSHANADFVRNFMQHVSPEDAAEMQTSDGKLNPAGIRRIEDALLLRAYGDLDLFSLMREEGDEDVRGIANALVNSAGDVARLAAGVESGGIPKEYDIIPALRDVIRVVKEARRRGVTIGNILANQDFIGTPDPRAEELLHVGYGDALKGRIKADFGKFLTRYVEAAEEASRPTLFGDQPSQEQVFEQARTGSGRAGGNRGPLPAPPPGGRAGGDGAGNGEARTGGGQAGRAAPRPGASGGGGAAPEGGDGGVGPQGGLFEPPPETPQPPPHGDATTTPAGTPFSLNPPRVNWDEAAAERYRAANAEHRDRRQTFTGDRTNRHAVGQVLQRGDEVGSFRMAASQVGPRLFGGAKQAENSAAFLRAIGGRTEDEAAQVFRRRAVDENGAFDPQRFDAMMTARREALNGLKDYIATDLRAHAELNGRIDPGKYQRWLQQHRAALSDYPDVAAQFDTAAKASESLKLLEDARAQIDKAHPLAGVGELGSLPPRYWRQGPAGADWVRRYVQHTGGSPEAMATMDDYALSSLRDAAWRNGTWSNAGFANWERQFAPALAERPDLRAKLRTVADAQAALADQATKKAEALKQWQDSAARFWIGTDPDKAMSRLVSSRNPVVEAQDLVRLTKHDPAALAGVKRAAADWLMNRVREVAEAGTSGEKGVSKNSLQRIFEKNPTASGALRVLLGNDAMDVIGRVSRDMDRQARSWEATKIPASPGSAADHAALRKGANLPFMVQMFGAEFVSELATHLAGAHGTGGFLIAQAGAAGALVLNAMRVAGLRNMQELEAYALLDPQGLGRLVLSHASTPVAREALAHKLAKRLIQLSTSQAQLRHNTAVQR